MSDMVRNPENRFSHEAAHLMIQIRHVLEEQSDEGLHNLLFYMHHLGITHHGRTS